ncbi:hypothetical protein [Bifidobacterium aquikefiri]
MAVLQPGSQSADQRRMIVRSPVELLISSGLNAAELASQDFRILRILADP